MNSILIHQHWRTCKQFIDIAKKTDTGSYEWWLWNTSEKTGILQMALILNIEDSWCWQLKFCTGKTVKDNYSKLKDLFAAIKNKLEADIPEACKGGRKIKPRPMLSWYDFHDGKILQ